MEQSHTHTVGVTAKQTWDFTSQTWDFSGRNSSYPQIWGANSTCTSRASEPWDWDVPTLLYLPRTLTSGQGEFLKWIWNFQSISNHRKSGIIKFSTAASERDRKTHPKFSKGRMFTTFPLLQCSQSRCWFPFDRIFNWTQCWFPFDFFSKFDPQTDFFNATSKVCVQDKYPRDPLIQITASTFLLYPGLGLHMEQHSFVFPSLNIDFWLKQEYSANQAVFLHFFPSNPLHFISGKLIINL